MMNLTAILKVFRDSTLITERGEFKISRVFTNAKAASKARYRYYRTENGVIMYAQRDRAGNTLFAVVDK